MNSIIYVLLSIIVLLVSFSLILVSIKTIKIQRAYEKLIKKSDDFVNKQIITEFEKAKAEMKKRRDALDNGDLNDFKKCKMQGYSDSMGILDHRIKELKGENNE